MFLVAESVSAQDADEVVTVVGQTPLGAGIDADKIASNVQSVGGEAIRERHFLDLSQAMRRNLASVFVNDAQSNPLQPDLQYRGFVGSPLLGLSQGLAIYQDGVRLNEPFGDTVNWALIPDSAIKAVYLMPGSNPLFGLNAIGGAIAIETRDGFSDQGASAEVFGGSFGRRGLRASAGGSADGFGHFVTGEYIEEDGWRDFSPTEVAQVFGKLGWRTDRRHIDLSLGLADTDLVGNGAAPIGLLALDRKSIFTRPDRTKNSLALLNMRFDQDVSDELSLAGNVYLRKSDVATHNGDDSNFHECVNSPGLICAAEGGEEAVIFDGIGDPIPAEPALEGATVNRTKTRQYGLGFGIQGSWTASLKDHSNLLVIGLAYDSSSIAFDASTELGSLDATRLAVPGGVFVGESFTDLGVDSANLGLFVADTFGLSDRVDLTVSGRYNRIEVTLDDRLGTGLNGDHVFDRFNPAVGLTASVTDAVSVYAGYSESSRAPSPVELTCADENDPCRLPNAFLADPPLEQVVAGTYEAGGRGRVASIDWHAGLFRTTSYDDILFVSAGALTNEGYFDNIGETRREGIELNLEGVTTDGLQWFTNYTHLDATFRDPVTILSPNNPAAIGGEVQVRPGDRLPLIPRQLLKAGVDLPLGSRFNAGADVYVSSGFHLRGDEGNDVGEIGAAVTLNLRADYQVGDRLTLFLNVDNLFDRRYETFGLFGNADAVLGTELADTRFLSPAGPRAAWVGVQVDL